MGRRRRVNLMPVIVLAALSLMVAVPMLSTTRLYAASAQHYAIVTVKPGDTLWSIAAGRSADGDVQDTIDRIASANHLRGVSLQPGERLRIPL